MTPLLVCGWPPPHFSLTRQGTDGKQLLVLMGAREPPMPPANPDQPPEPQLLTASCWGWGFNVRIWGAQHLVRTCAPRTCPVSSGACRRSSACGNACLSPPCSPCGSVALCLFSSDEDSGHVESGATLLQVTSQSLGDIFKGPIST